MAIIRRQSARASKGSISMPTNNSDYNENRRSLSYLAIASGFFGRLSLDTDVPFNEVTELSQVAKEIVRD